MVLSSCYLLYSAVCVCVFLMCIMCILCFDTLVTGGGIVYFLPYSGIGTFC